MGVVVASCFLLLVAVLAAGASFLAPHSPSATSLIDSLLPPGSPDHLFGTDSTGRDVLSRLMHGAQLSLLAPLGVVTIATVALDKGGAGLNAGSKHCCCTAPIVWAPIASLIVMSYQSSDRRSRDSGPLAIGDWITTPAVHVSAVSGTRPALPTRVGKAKPNAAADWVGTGPPGGP